MKNQTQSQPLLHIPPLMWQEFRQAMLDARQDREEVIGFLFCQRLQIAKKRWRYVPLNWIVPTPDCYERQSEIGLVLKQSFHQYILDTYLGNGRHAKDSKLDVVHIHTHFGDAKPTFSAIDDRHEAEYARFLSFCYRSKPRLISGVFNESLDKSQFRLWDRRGLTHFEVEFHHSWFIPAASPILNNIEKNCLGGRSKFVFDEGTLDLDFRETDKTRKGERKIDSEIFARQQIFGTQAQKRLGELKVALIGCGGIGAVFAEQLSRLGVRYWCLIDPDRLEMTNLNRMPGSTEQMANQSWLKVHYVKWLIKKAYSEGSQVLTLPHPVEDKSVEAEIAKADLIVVATDNHKSRQVAQELATKYVRPLLTLGTQIEVKEGQPQLYARVTVPPLGGGWCLMCANIISLQQAALETAPPQISDLAQKVGYLPDIDNPAVYWLNSLCASSGVGVVHGMLAGFLDLDKGLDWIYDFSHSLWHKTDIERLLNRDCYFCSHHPSTAEKPAVMNNYKSMAIPDSDLLHSAESQLIEDTSNKAEVRAHN